MSRRSPRPVLSPLLFLSCVLSPVSQPCCRSPVFAVTLGELNSDFHLCALTSLPFFLVFPFLVPPPFSAPACPVPPMPPQRSLHCQLAIPSPTHNRIFFFPVRLTSLPLGFVFLFSVLSPPFQLPLALCPLCPPTLSRLKLAIPSCTQGELAIPSPTLNRYVFLPSRLPSVPSPHAFPSMLLFASCSCLLAQIVPPPRNPAAPHR